MKQFLLKTIIMAASIGIVVSCSSANTQRENTTVGAVTGAVVGGVAGSAIGAGTGQVVAIGAGAIAGALIGGYIGNSMDHSDNVHAAYVLEHNPQHKSTHWKNQKSGSHYTMVPTSKHFSLNGNANCRTYRTTAWIKGQKQELTGTACRQTNGTWQAVTTQ